MIMVVVMVVIVVVMVVTVLIWSCGLVGMVRRSGRPRRRVALAKRLTQPTEGDAEGEDETLTPHPTLISLMTLIMMLKAQATMMMTLRPPLLHNHLSLMQPLSLMTMIRMMVTIIMFVW